jgi:hypothetical protein
MPLFSIFLSRSSKLYNSLEITLTLDPKSNIAWYYSFPIAISIFGIHASPSLEHLQPSPRLGPRMPYFTSGWRYSAQPCPRFLVFARIWAFIHPASPGHPRLSEARSGTPDETKKRQTASGPAVSARERIVPRH